MCLQPCQNLLFGPFINRAIMVADEREAGDGKRCEDTRYKAIRRLSRRAVMVDCTADLAQAERQRFCASMLFFHLTIGDVDHRLRRLPRDEFPQLKQAW